MGKSFKSFKKRTDLPKDVSKTDKDNSEIYALDSFGFFAEDIKNNTTNYDPHYLGSYKPFTKKTRFKDFNHLNLQKQLNDILIKKGSNLNII